MATKNRSLTTQEAPFKEWRAFYITDNPMRIEVQRIIRRFFVFNSGNQSNSAIFGLILLLFGIMTVWTMNARGTVSPVMILAIYTLLMFILNPILFHGTIAGERERRSWDMLLVAPVTHGQIIVGKIMASFMLNAGVLAVLGIPMLLAAITHARTNWWALFLISLASLAAMLSCSASTVLLSARAKRPLVSLGTSLGTVVVVYLLLPLLTSSIGGMYGSTNQFLFAWHPFSLFGMYWTLEAPYNYISGEAIDLSQFAAISTAGITAIVFHIFLALVLTVWSIKTLVFADNEVRFIGKGPKGASQQAQ